MTVEVQRKLRFSQRVGETPVPELQVKNLNPRTRNRILHALHVAVAHQPHSRLTMQMVNIARAFGASVLGHANAGWSDLEKIIVSGHWAAVYDALEFLFEGDMFYDKSSAFRRSIHDILVEELAPFRFLHGQLTPQFAEVELQEIRAALGRPGVVAQHLGAALGKLAQRPNPDFRNSIKESISAVEAACRIVAGMPKATLGEALRAIEKAGVVRLHSAQREGFSKIYGWTSDQGGIRHALAEGEDTLEEDARYMLVSCTAFVELLRAKATVAGIALTGW